MVRQARSSGRRGGGEFAAAIEEKEKVMSLERWIRLIAGTFVTVSIVLSYLQSPYWLFFTLFVGLNLFQSALTRWCLMEDLLRKLGVKSHAAPGA
jgi:DUF2892 family protein